MLKPKTFYTYIVDILSHTYVHHLKKCWELSWHTVCLLCAGFSGNLKNIRAFYLFFLLLLHIKRKTKKFYSKSKISMRNKIAHDYVYATWAYVPFPWIMNISSRTSTLKSSLYKTFPIFFSRVSSYETTSTKSNTSNDMSCAKFSSDLHPDMTMTYRFVQT